MTNEEQKAFVKAYGNHIGDVPDSVVADYVARFEARENIPYGEGHTSILDALLMWNEAIKWSMIK